MLVLFPEIENAEDEALPPPIRGLYREMAEVTDTFARDLDEVVAEWMNETLSIKDAAEASGYCAEVLRRAIRRGRLKNAGRPNAPLIRRVDMPRKL